MSPQSSSTLVEIAPPSAKVSWSVMPQRRWDDPQLSAGTPHASLDLLGRFKCWSLKDKSPAHMMWKTVSKAIISLLEDRYEHLDAGGSELMVEMFMVGRKPTSTSPTLLFSCESKACRQKAMGLVKKKGILNDHPGVLMAECSKLPRPLALAEELDAPQLPPGVYLNGPLLSFGTSVLVYSKEGVPPRNATIGGFVTIEDELFGVTAAHVFFPPAEEGNSDDEKIEFAFFGDEEPYDSGDDEDLVDLTSRASLSSGSSSSPSFDESEHSLQPSVTSSSGSTLSERVIPARNNAVIDIGGEKTAVKLGDLFALSEAGDRLDWALVKIRASSASAQPSHLLLQSHLAWEKNMIYPKSVEDATADVGVLISTGSSGIVEGTLSPVASFSINTDTHATQSLLTVRRPIGTFSDGDCGSWVFDKETGDVYGHIVSGFPATGIAYIVPSLEIFQDITRRIVKPVKLFAPMANRARQRISENSSPKIDGPVTHKSDASGVGRFARAMGTPETTHSTFASSSRIEPAAPQVPINAPIVPQPAYIVDVDDDGKTIHGSKKSARAISQKLKHKKSFKGKGKEQVENSATAPEMIPKPSMRVTPSRYLMNSNSSYDSGYASSRHSTASFASTRVSNIQEDEILSTESSTVLPVPSAHKSHGFPKLHIPFTHKREDPSHFGVPNSTSAIVSQPNLSQPIPMRPRPMTSQMYPTRPLSYHTAYTSAGGYGPPLSASAWSNYQPMPSVMTSYGMQPLYDSSSHMLDQDRRPYSSDQLVGRPPSSFGDAGGKLRPAVQRSVYAVGEESDDDDGYASAPETSMNIPRVKSYQLPSSTGTEVTNRPNTSEQDSRAMPPPPPRPILQRPAPEHDPLYWERRTSIQNNSQPPPRRLSSQRNSVSYDLGDGPERVRVEIANTSKRRQSYYDQTVRPSRPSFHRNSVSYDLGDRAMPSPPPISPPLLTAEVLRGYRGHSGSSSTSRSIRSGSSDDWRSTSTAPTDYGDSENVTIKVAGTARVMVGGAEIDCPDGEEIEIRQIQNRNRNSGIGTMFPDTDMRPSRRAREKTYTRGSREADDKAKDWI